MYEDYYSRQVGGLMLVFVGSRHQRGHGLGSVLEGIFHRFVIPLFKTHNKALARDALRTGVNVVEDVLDGRTLKESVKRRVPEGINRSAQSDSSVWIRRSSETTQEKPKVTLAFERHLCMMAFAHYISCKCTKSKLNLFSVPPTQTSMEH